MNNSTLSNRLKNLREKNGYLQKFVADKLGIRSNTLSGYENGTRSPDPEMLVELANLYNVTTDYLLGHDIENNIDNEELRRTAIMNKIATEFPDADLMFNDIKSWTAKDFEELYDYIKFKKSQKDKEH